MFYNPIQIIYFQLTLSTEIIRVCGKQMHYNGIDTDINMIDTMYSNCVIL